MVNIIFSKRFVVQLILIFIVFTLATMIGYGIPVAWLVGRQTDIQMRALLDQAKQTTIALYDNKTFQLQNFAELTAERPTLNYLLLEGDQLQALQIYLDDYQKNSGIDAIIICSANSTVATAGDGIDRKICETLSKTDFSAFDDEVWLISSARLSQEDLTEKQVLIGHRVKTILDEFKLQSGLDYVLLHENELLVSSSIDDVEILLGSINPPIEHYQTLSLRQTNLNRHSHMTAIIPLTNNEGFNLIGLLNIEANIDLGYQLRNIILATLLAVSLVGIILAMFVSRRISKPLNRLAKAATALREGDLTTRLTSSSKIWEIDQLTNALEDARVGLKHSLDHLRMEKIWIENLLNSIVEGILTIDEQHRITYASEAIERIVGVTTYSIIGRLIDDFFISASGEDLFSYQIPDPNQSRRIPVLINGKDVLLAVSTSLIIPPEAGNATRALVIRDVTDEELIHRLIGEFMANITHEFRTPLSALSASVELLMDQLSELSISEIEHLLNALNIGIIDLQALIDNLIEAASIEAGRFKVNTHSVELHSIIMDAVNTIQPIAKKHRMNIFQPKKRQSFLVIADRRRTSQALINLLSNAIKHSPEGGNITILILILEKEVLVEVRDEGQGVSPNLRAQLFNRFIMPNDKDDFSQLGLGIGLSVVKAIIEAQHGRVGFKENETGGSVFWFTLPMDFGGES